MAALVQRGALSAPRPRAARALVLALASVVAAACVGPFHPSIERSALVADRAAALRMPGAAEVAHFGAERELTVEGPAFAFDTYMFGTHAGAAEVLDFYERELGRLGWTRDDVAISMSTTDLDIRGWCKPRMTFRLAIKHPRDHPRWIAAAGGTAYPTFFDAGLIGRDQDRGCPWSPRSSLVHPGPVS